MSFYSLCESTSCDDIKEAIASRIIEKRIVFANAAAKNKAEKLK
jgi:hypothetical protein